MIVIEGLSAIMIALSIWWYPARSGWRRTWAPLTQMIGCLGFVVLAIDNALWLMAALNASLIAVNLINFEKICREVD